MTGESVPGGRGAGDGASDGDEADDLVYDEDILGDQKFMVADDEIVETFGSDTFTSLRQGRSRWVARFSGEGLDGPSADPLKTAALIRRLAITTRWIANGLYPGNRGIPGFVLGEASHSIVLGFTLAPEEKPVSGPKLRKAEEPTPSAADDGPTREVYYPTVEGGRFFATLLASSQQPDRLTERLGHVGKQAIQTYQGALKEFVEYGVELDFLVPSMPRPTDPRLRRIHVPVEESESGLSVLQRVPEDVTKTFEVEGVLYTQNALNNEFGIQLDNGDHVTGEFDLAVVDKLGPAWRNRVWARIQEIGPKQDWMPRAGRVRRRLEDVVVLQEGETRLLKP